VGSSALFPRAESRSPSFQKMGPSRGSRRELPVAPIEGRGQELSRLHKGLEGATDGRGSLWSITGPAGVGKTRLMTELARIAVRNSFTVRWGLSTWEGQTPLFPFLQLLRPRPGDPVVSAIVRDARDLVSRRRKRGFRTDSREGHHGRSPDHVALDLLDAIDEAAQASPQLFLIDDFHRSDPDSVRFLGLLARQVSTRRVLVVISFREESPLFQDAVPEGLTDLLAELRIAGLLQPIELAGLQEEAMARVAKNWLRTSLPKARWSSLALAPVVRAAGGNPFFLRELTSLLVEAKRAPSEPLSTETASALWTESPREIPLPRSIQDLLHRRLSGLSRDHRRILGTAAIVGETFSEEDVAAGLPTNEPMVRQLLRRMGDLEWPIRRLGASGDQYAFQHSLLRKSSLELLPLAQRRRLAGRLAAWWSQHHPEELESIARLYAESNRPTGGLRAVDRLIEEALESHGYASLDRCLQWKSRIVGQSSVARQRFLSSYFRVLQRLRPNGPSELGNLCHRFLGLHPPDPDRSIVAAWYIDCVVREDLPHAARLLEQLRRRLTTQSRSIAAQVRIHFELSQLRLRINRGEIGEGLRIARRLHRRLRTQGPSYELVLTSQIAASCLYRLARFSESMRWGRRGFAIARRAGLAGTTIGFSLLEWEAAAEHRAGNLSKAVVLNESLAQGYAELGSFLLSANSWTNAATSRIILGDFSGARRAVSTGLQLARRWSLPGPEGVCLATFGTSLLAEGRVDEAERYFQRALHVLQGAPDAEPGELEARIGLARVYLGREELEETEVQLRIAESLSRRAFFPFETEIERVRARWLERKGDLQGARRLLLRLLTRSSSGPFRVDRLETLAAVARLERSMGHTHAGRRWERKFRTEAARSGIDVNLPIFWGAWEMGFVAAPARNRSVAPQTKDGQPLRSAGAGRRISHRVLRTLARLGAISGGPRDTDEVSPSFTQAGLAVELGIPRGSFVRTLLRLVDRGAVVQVSRRVEGAARAQKAYLLTERGVEMATATPL
jgi:tetratricopeptide (TPR) repeat protein